MKPDKHKKEKNEAYKKKHGINNDIKQDKKGASSGVEQNRKHPRDSSNQHLPSKLPSSRNSGANSEADTNKQHGNLNKFVYHESAAKPVRDSSEEIEPSQTKLFRRREVVSNWQRYEVEEDSLPTVRGSDFASLLKSSANVLSHFQYRDELGLMNEDGKLDSSTKFLSLDCDDLANALMCIPLHERMCIDNSVFEPSFLQTCNEESTANAVQYRSKLKSSSKPMDHTEDTSSSKCKETNYVQNTMLLNDSEKIQDQNPIQQIVQQNSGQFVESLAPQKGVSLNYIDPENVTSRDVEFVENVTSCDVDSTKVSLELPACSKTELTGEKKQSDTEDVENTLNPSPVCDARQAPLKEVKGNGNSVQSKQTLEELENELDMLLSL